MSGKLIWILLPVCGLLVWGAFRIDAPVREAVVASHGKDWKDSADNRFHSSVRVYGDWPPLMVGCLVALALARILKSRRWMRVIAAAMIASTLAGLLGNVSRLTTGRTRPKESPKIEQGFYGPWHDGKLLVGKPAYILREARQVVILGVGGPDNLVERHHCRTHLTADPFELLRGRFSGLPLPCITQHGDARKNSTNVVVHIL